MSSHSSHGPCKERNRASHDSPQGLFSLHGLCGPCGLMWPTWASAVFCSLLPSPRQSFPNSQNIFWVFCLLRCMTENKFQELFFRSCNPVLTGSNSELHGVLQGKFGALPRIPCLGPSAFSSDRERETEIDKD